MHATEFSSQSNGQADKIKASLSYLKNGTSYAYISPKHVSKIACESGP